MFLNDWLCNGENGWVVYVHCFGFVYRVVIYYNENHLEQLQWKWKHINYSFAWGKPQTLGYLAYKLMDLHLIFVHLSDNFIEFTMALLNIYTKYATTR